MAVNLAPLGDIIHGVTNQCELFDKVKELIVFANELQICSNQNDSDIGDMSLLTSHSNIVDAIISLLSSSHIPATSGDAIIDVDPLTQEITFNAAGWVSFLEDPINTPIVEALMALFDTNKFVENISFDPLNPSQYVYTYNDGSTATFVTGISADANQTLTYGSDGLPYYNFANLIENSTPVEFTDQITFHRPSTGIDYRMSSMQDIVDFLQNELDHTDSNLTDNNDGTYEFINDLGSVIIDTNADTSNVADLEENFVSTTVEGVLAELAQIINDIVIVSSDVGNQIIEGSDGGAFFQETVTNISNNGDGTYTHTSEDGTETVISLPELTDNGDGTYTWDNQEGTVIEIVNDASTTTYDNSISNIIANDVQEAIDIVDQRIDDLESTSHVPMNATSVDSTVDITSSGIDNQTIDFSVDVVDTMVAISQDIAAMAVYRNAVETTTNLSYDPLTTTLSYVNEDGNTQVVNLSALTSDIFVNGGTLVGTTLILSDNDGSTSDIIIDFSDFLSKWTDNNDGTYLHDDGQGNSFLLDFNAAALPFDNTLSGMPAIDVQDAIDNIYQTLHEPANISTTDGGIEVIVSGIDNQTFEINRTSPMWMISPSI